MEVLTFYSETGGASKTTSAVSIATAAARGRGMKTVLLDLDPRGAATKWTQAEPKQEGWTTNAILSQDDVEGYVEDMAVPVSWGGGKLSIVPSSRSVSNRESDDSDSDYRLLTALEGLDADLVVIDAPNRQGGPLIRAALMASTGVVYAATPDGDGVDGVEGARETVERFTTNLRRIKAPNIVEERGIILNKVWNSPVGFPKIELASIEDLRATGLLLEPFVPMQTIIKQVRVTGEWFGDYRAGQTPKDQYEALLEKVMK